MARIDDLLKIDGAVAAGEFAPEARWSTSNRT